MNVMICDKMDECMEKSNKFNCCACPHFGGHEYDLDCQQKCEDIKDATCIPLLLYR